MLWLFFRYHEVVWVVYSGTIFHGTPDVTVANVSFIYKLFLWSLHRGPPRRHSELVGCSLLHPEIMRSAFFLVFVPSEDGSSPNKQQRGTCGVNEAALGASGVPPIFWSPPTFRLEQMWSLQGATSTMPSNSPATAELPQTPDNTINDVVKKLQIPHFDLVISAV